MLSDAITFLENMLDPHIWQRVGFVLLGGILIIFALTQFQTSNRAFQIGRALL
jgi:hypothetical protein